MDHAGMMSLDSSSTLPHQGSAFKNNDGTVILRIFEVLPLLFVSRCYLPQKVFRQFR